MSQGKVVGSEWAMVVRIKTFRNPDVQVQGGNQDSEEQRHNVRAFSRGYCLCLHQEKPPLGVFAAMVRSRSPRRYQCVWEGCGKACGTKHNLSHPIRATHEGLQPYICVICQISFGHTCRLDKHKRGVHESNRSYVCDLCEATLGRKTTLRPTNAVCMKAAGHSNVTSPKRLLGGTPHLTDTPVQFKNA